MAWETQILVKENWQDLQNAYTNVTFTFQARRTDYSVNSYNNYGQAYWKISAGGNTSGTNYFNFSWNYGQNVWFTIASWTTSIKHNSDGSYSGTATATCYTALSNIGTLNATKSYTLTSIPRASTISSTSGTTIGSSVTINISRKSSSFVHQVWYRINSSGSWVSLGDNFGTSCTFTLPMSVCNQIPNATSATLNICLRTLSNGTAIGSDVYFNKTVNVPSSVVPSFTSLSVSEAESSVSPLGIYVQNKSKLKVSITGVSGSYGSTISSYLITVGDQTIRSSSGTTNVLSTNGTVTITAKITDSRGRTASKTASITVHAYSNPKITAYSISRQSTPTNVLAVASGNVTSLKNGTTEKNTLSYSIKYKQISSNTYTTVSVTTSGLTFTDLSKTLSNIVSDKSYDISLVIADYFSEIEYPFTLGTAIVLSDINKNGIGIGKYWEHGALDVGGAIYGTELNISGDALVRNGKRVAVTYDGDCTNFNTCLTEGEYLVDSSASLTGAPYTGAIHGKLRVYVSDGETHNYSNNWIWQYFDDTSGRCMMRYKVGMASWTAWKRTNYAPMDEQVTDWVIAKGTYGIWTYRKWSSGIAECWGTWTGTINLSQNNYSGFYYTNSITVNYLSGLFIEAPSLHVDRGPTNFMAGMRAFGDTNTYARFVAYGHSTSSQSSVDVYLYAIGKWK